MWLLTVCLVCDIAMLWLFSTVVVCGRGYLWSFESVWWLWLCATTRVFLGDRDDEHFSFECVGHLSLFQCMNCL